MNECLAEVNNKLHNAVSDFRIKDNKPGDEFPVAAIGHWGFFECGKESAATGKH